jgi:hypothetical protein
MARKFAELEAEMSAEAIARSDGLYDEMQQGRGMMDLFCWKCGWKGNLAKGPYPKYDEDPNGRIHHYCPQCSAEVCTKPGGE